MLKDIDMGKKESVYRNVMYENFLEEGKMEAKVVVLNQCISHLKLI